MPVSGVIGGRFAALRGHARSHRSRAFLECSAKRVGAGAPAKGCKAAPITLKGQASPFGAFFLPACWSAWAARKRHRPTINHGPGR
ncbi:hypothetical protein HV87_11085 [Pseudomonas aeruginosa]|nr:hypothetical protein HV87_11085 [Pseudomonas aeruginosa]